MDEAIRKYCGLLMFDTPPSFPYKNNGKVNSSSLTIDHTTSLENSSIRTQDNFVFTSFLEPIRVKRQNPIKNKPIILDSDSSLLNNEVEKTSNLVQPSSEDRTPRPPNAFILYRRSKQPEVTREHGNISNARISKILAKLWREEDENVKHYWQKMADKKKMEHMLAHPGYVYRPKKPGENKKKKNHRKSKATPKESPGPLIPLCHPPAQTQNSFVFDSPQDPTIISTDSSSPYILYDNHFEPYSQITPIFSTNDIDNYVYSNYIDCNDYNVYNDYNDYNNYNDIESNNLFDVQQYPIDQNIIYPYEHNFC
ncbi:8785_t:CDS:1 [Racocetra persica]|uniref:8785_t:CDS:1 n=1 Tax=Racocetra persica TaxID=160502 RepID=A0ACA9QR04_9GLOM|nr:8785_t:CDS:1 [Racocetra persica]